jgi:sortase (surface protein transpeptidase)
MALAIRLTGSKRGRVYIIDPTQIILPYEWDTIRIKYGKKNRKIIGKCMALLASVFVRMFNNSITF